MGQGEHTSAFGNREMVSKLRREGGRSWGGGEGREYIWAEKTASGKM